MHDKQCVAIEACFHQFFDTAMMLSRQLDKGEGLSLLREKGFLTQKGLLCVQKKSRGRDLKLCVGVTDRTGKSRQRRRGTFRVRVRVNR